MAELGLFGAIRGNARKKTLADPGVARPGDLVGRRFESPAPNRLCSRRRQGTSMRIRFGQQSASRAVRSYKHGEVEPPTKMECTMNLTLYGSSPVCCRSSLRPLAR